MRATEFYPRVQSCLPTIITQINRRDAKMTVRLVVLGNFRMPSFHSDWSCKSPPRSLENFQVHTKSPQGRVAKPAKLFLANPSLWIPPHRAAFTSL